MRAPGESIGTFAVESAMDALAYELKIDPVELRMRNEPEKDPVSGNEFSSRHMREAYRMGAEKFGWQTSACRSRVAARWRLADRPRRGYRHLSDVPHGHRGARTHQLPTAPR